MNSLDLNCLDASDQDERPDEEMLGVSAAPLGRLLHDSARLRRQVFDACSAPVGLTRAQFWVLSFLGRSSADDQPKMTQTEIARALNVGKVTLGSTLDRLQAKGLVRRVIVPRDRRVKHVYITPKGRRALESMEVIRPLVDELMVRGISPDDQEKLSRSLSIMRQNLNTMKKMHQPK